MKNRGRVRTPCLPGRARAPLSTGDRGQAGGGSREKPLGSCILPVSAGEQISANIACVRARAPVRARVRGRGRVGVCRARVGNAYDVPRGFAGLFF